jgi:hypothetical protein
LLEIALSMPQCDAEFERLTLDKCRRKCMVIFDTLDMQPNMPLMSLLLSHDRNFTYTNAIQKEKDGAFMATVAPCRPPAPNFLGLQLSHTHQLQCSYIKTSHNHI